MEIVNMLDTKINPIDWLIPRGKSWFKISTTQKMQRIVWAIVLFFGFLALLLIVGIFKTVQISLTVAYREFESALQDSETVEISNSQKIDEIALSQVRQEVSAICDSECDSRSGGIANGFRLMRWRVRSRICCKLIWKIVDFEIKFKNGSIS